MFRQVLNTPDPRYSIPVSSPSIMGLNPLAPKMELRPKRPSIFYPANPYLKEALEKFEQEFRIANISEGKFIKPSPSTEKWYKMVDPRFEEKVQELKRDFT